MPHQCIVCKKESVREESRSFHKFPSKHEPRQAWLDALKLSKCGKQARVCSDHFDGSCFHDTDGYTTRRRLKNSAVPTILQSEKQNLQQERPDNECNSSDVHEQTSDSNDMNDVVGSENATTTKEHTSAPTYIAPDGLSADNSATLNNDDEAAEVKQQCASGSGTNPSNNRSRPKRKLLNRDGESSVKDEGKKRKTSESQSGEKSSSSAEQKNSRKRKSSMDDVVASVPEKRIRVKVKHRFIDFYRKDFASQKKWEDFKETMKYKGLIYLALQKRVKRAEKKIENIKQLVEEMKKKNESAIAEFLQVFAI